MFLDRALNQWGLRVARGQRTSVPKITPEPSSSTGITSPYDVLKGRNNVLLSAISESVTPGIPRSGDLVALPDQPMGASFVCKRNAEGEAVFWLDPTKWSQTLEDFSGFIKSAGGRGVDLEIFQHVPASHPLEHEWVNINTVRYVRDGVSFKSGLIYGLDEKGRVSVGSPEIGFYDIGYLDSHRVNIEAIEEIRRGF